ncbi:MAG: tryptophan synthase subunit alpha [Spirochaetaceae bacterium]|nr:MAG: tryptophan synthase subunit alpha [Spirochaetaceae bacterium]
MAHMIPWYPDAERSFEVAKALLDAGVDFLEVQFPYSDPTADGPAIQKACSDALEGGFKVEAGFAFLDRVRAYRDVPIFLMSYAGIVFRKGVTEFVQRAADHGVSALIVPDLPPGSDEGLYEAATTRGLHAVPVLVVTARKSRIDAVAALKPAYLYAALRAGITGERTAIGSENLAFLDALSPIGAHIMAGFGVQSSEQIEALRGHVDSVVVGSAFVRAVDGCGSGSVYQAVYDLAADLTGHAH